MQPSMLVTGGTKGTGYAIAERFAREGYAVFITSRQEEAAVQAARKIADNYGVPAKGYALGVTDEKQVADVFGDIRRQGYLIRTVVLNAANLGIGMDPLTGTERFTFNNVALLSGVDLIPVIIGLFSVSEVLRKSKEKTTLAPELREIKTNIKIKIFDMEIFKRIWRTMAKSSIIGVIIGILPGIGATTAAMVSYSEAVRSSKNPEEFGTGIPEGIAAPETANNAAAMGTLIPLISLGIPGGATAAVLLGAFVLHGLQPGPMLIVNAPDLVYTLFIALLLGNILILLLSKPFIRVFSKILNIPYMALGPMILVFCIIGTYAVNKSVFDIWIMLLFGLLGYLFDKIKFPISTIILGLVLGPLTETEFRRSLEMSNGDFSIFFTRPISCGLLILAAIAFIYGLYKTYKKQSSVRVIAD